METKQEFRYVPSGDAAQNVIQKKRLLLFSIIGLLCLVIVAGSYVGAFTKATMAPSLLPPYVISQLDDDGKQLLSRLQREPCNRTTANELANQLVDREEYSSVLAIYESSIKQCGTADELLPMVFAAQMDLSNFAAAEKTANIIVAAFPADPDSYGWRSQAREKTDDIAGAYTDMKKALQLFPDPANVSAQTYYNAARLAAQAGHPCEAMTIMRDYMAYDVSDRKTQQISTMANDWRQQGACPPMFGTGTAALRYNTYDGSIIVPVEINGALAHMIVDTGATMTVLTSGLAKRAGIQASEQKGSEAVTANGTIWESSGQADIIKVGEARLTDVPVSVHTASKNTFGDGIDGLLGLSFLGNFQVHINNGLLELKPLN